jgi:hypothetical protein
MFVRALMLASLTISPMISAPPRAAARTNPSAAAGEPGLVGTWRLHRYENRSKDGKVDKPYRERPLGYFVYDVTGHPSIHIMRNPPLPRYAAVGEDDAPTDAESRNP